LKKIIVSIIILIVICGIIIVVKPKMSGTDTQGIKAETKVPAVNLDKEITDMLGQEKIIKSGQCEIDGTNINIAIKISSKVDAGQKIELVNKYNKIAKDKYKDKNVSVVVTPED